jgi:hypothetical protein
MPLLATCWRGFWGEKTIPHAGALFALFACSVELWEIPIEILIRISQKLDAPDRPSAFRGQRVETFRLERIILS